MVHFYHIMKLKKNKPVGFGRDSILYHKVTVQNNITQNDLWNCIPFTKNNFFDEWHSNFVQNIKLWFKIEVTYMSPVHMSW